MGWVRGFTVKAGDVATVLKLLVGAGVSAAGLGVSHGGTLRWFGFSLFVVVPLLAVVVWRSGEGATASRPAASASASPTGSRLKLRAAGVVGLAAATLVLTSMVLMQIAAPRPSYASGFDGQDPHFMKCIPDARPLGGGWPIQEAGGQTIGRLFLFQSDTCSTVWPKILLTLAASRRLKGDSIRILVERPADDIQNIFFLRLLGDKKYGWSNMLGHSKCVFARVQLKLNTNKPGGPPTQSACL